MSTPRITVQAQEFVTRVVARGLRGERGQGVIPGGAQGQILGKRSDDDYDTEWLNPGDAPSLVNSVAATAPITSTGGVNPVIGIDPATPSASGSMSADDKAKLDNLLLSSAPPPVAASSQAGASTRAAREDHTHAHGSQGGGTLHATASGGVGGSAGFMSVADKNKLDSIAAGAQVNVATNLGIGGSGNARTVTSSTGGSATLPIATQSNAGVMSTEDKTKLDGISPGATVYTNALARGQVEAMLVAGSNVSFSYAGSGASRTLTINATLSGGGGSGTVTSVGLSLPGDVFQVSGSPVTASGTLSAAFAEQPANAFFAGPAGGGPLFSDIPTFRLLAPEDIPQFPLSRASLNGTEFLAGVGTSTNEGFGLGPITLGTGFVWGASSLDLSTNLQGWHAVAPSSKQDTLTAGDNITIVDGVISAAGGGASAAEDVTYDNTTSGLAATDVQAAIDEVVGLIPSGGGGDAFISQMQRWGAVIPGGASLKGIGCFVDMSLGANAWLGAGTGGRSTHILYTLAWSRALSSAATNSQVLHVSGSPGDAAAGSRFRRKNSQSSSYEGFSARVRFALTGPDFGTPSVIKNDYQFLAGLVSASPGTTVEPSTLTNCIFVGKDSTDANWQLMHNDASGTCTKVDLGAGLSASGIDRIPFEFRVSAPRGGSTMTWSLVRLDTFEVSASGTVSTDLIATDATVFPAMMANTGPTTTTRVDAYCGGTFMVSDWAVA